MATSGFALLLHAHLPWVRHPEHDRFHEEEWLYEAIVEVYIPLLRVLRTAAERHPSVRMTLGLTPTLLEMIADPLLLGRARRYMAERLDLCARLRREHPGSPLAPALADLERLYGTGLSTFAAVNDNLTLAFGEMQDRGVLEIVASAATHAVLPLLGTPEGQRAQVKVGVEVYNRHFGRFPHGFWLPECGWAEGVDQVLRGVAQKWTMVDARGLERAIPTPRSGTLSGVRSPAELLVFGRDAKLCAAVGGRSRGFPSDPLYREFYRDLGDELDPALLEPLLGPGEGRRWIGLKAWAITGPGREKQPYDPEAAAARARHHAEVFADAVRQRLTESKESHPIACVPFDAELFGHWWYEGPIFLGALFDALAARGVPMTTPSSWVGAHGESAPRARPAPGSWGEGGSFGLWCHPENEALWRHLHRNEERLVAVATRFHHERNPPRRARLLGQAARELLVAQGSDWTFILATGRGASTFAWRTVTEHLARCAAILTEIEGGDPLPRGRLEAWEEVTTAFADVRWTNWSRAPVTGEFESALLPGVI